VLARPVGVGERALKWVRRRPALAGLLAVCVLAALLLVGGGVAFTVQLRQALTRAETGESNARTKQAEAEAAGLATQAALNNERQAREDEARQRRLAEVRLYASKVALAYREWQNAGIARAHDLLEDCPRELRGWEHDHVRALVAGGQRVLSEGTFVGRVCPLPDGRRIAYAAGRAIKVWDTLTGERGVLPGDSAWSRFHLSPDGTRLVTGSPPAVATRSRASGMRPAGSSCLRAVCPTP
jgi:hypothetical protein